METTKYDEKLKPLFELIKKGDYNAVKKWVEDGNPVYNPESKAQSVLYYSASRDMFSILEFLLTLDWGKGSEPLNRALMQAVYNSHADNVRLLLEHEASPDYVPWYKLFDTYNYKIILLFLEHSRSVKDMGNDISGISKATARAFKDALPQRPDLEDVLIEGIIYFLHEAYYATQGLGYGCDTQEGRDKVYKTSASLAGLLKWTGCNIRKEIECEYDEENISALGYAIVQNDVKILKSLRVSVEDAAIVNKYAKSIYHCDADKMDYLVKCGLTINDNPDGTSSLLTASIKSSYFEMIAMLAERGAKLSVLQDEDLKYLRKRLFDSISKLPQGLFLALAKVFSIEQMKYIVTSAKTKDLLGDTPEIIIRNLYDPENSESPDAFATRINEMRENFKDDDLNPIAARYRSYCTKSDRERLPYPFQDDRPKYHFGSMHASKEVRPWIISLLNELVPELEKRNVKFEFEEKKGTYGNDIYVYFYANVRKYKIPIEFHEGQTSPKKYLSRGNEPTYTGKLQFCHRLDGSKIKLAEEKYFFQFKDKIEYLADRLVSVADNADRHEEERRQWHEEYERKEREREEKERRELEKKQRIQKHKAENKRKVEEMVEEEEEFFDDISSKAKAFEECRVMRHYLDVLMKDWKSKGDPNDEQKAWLLRAELLIKRHDPFQSEAPRTIQDIEFPDDIWDKSWAEIMEFIKTNLKA